MLLVLISVFLVAVDIQLLEKRRIQHWFRGLSMVWSSHTAYIVRQLTSQQGSTKTEDSSRPLLHLQRPVHISRTKHPTVPHHDSYIRYATGWQDRRRAYDSRYGLCKTYDGVGTIRVLCRPAAVEFVLTFISRMRSYFANNE